jgi:single-strand DNA-binding protein
MINKVILIGNLGRDPEVRHLESGAVVANFTMATNENYLDKKSGQWQKITQWHTIVAWRNLAERVEKSLKKGNLVYVEGKLTHRKYQDKEGVERYITEVVANVVRSLEKREEGSSSFGDSYSGSSQTSKPADSPTSTEKPEQFDDDDLPF